MTKTARHGQYRGKPCVVPPCTRFSLDEDVKFFPVPRDSLAREEFRKLCNVHHFQSQSLICSDHFTPEDFDEIGGLLLSARPSANLVSATGESVSPAESRRRQGSICAVLGCNKYAGDRKAENLHFFKCPLKPPPEASEEQKDLYNKWFTACSRLDLLEFAKHHRVCSRHFEDADVEQHPHACRTRLRPGSYPKKFLGKLKKAQQIIKRPVPFSPTLSVPVIPQAVVVHMEEPVKIGDMSASSLDNAVFLQANAVNTMEETPVVENHEVEEPEKIVDVTPGDTIEEIVPSDIWNSVISDGFQPPVADDGGTAWNVYKREADHIIFARIRPVLISHSSPLFYSSTVDFVRINRDLSVVLSSGNRIIPSQVVSSYFTESNLSAGGPMLSPFLYNFAAYDGIIFKAKK